MKKAAPEASWVREENLHLSIKFFGEQPDTAPAALEKILAAVAAAQPPLDLRISGLGAFPNLRAPRVVWMGVQHDPRLELMHHDVEATCAANGYRARRARLPPAHHARARARRDAARQRARACRRRARCGVQGSAAGDGALAAREHAHRWPARATPRSRRFHSEVGEPWGDASSRSDVSWWRSRSPPARGSRATTGRRICIRITQPVSRPRPRTPPAQWQPATPAGAARARAIIERLASRNGPVYGNVEAGDLVAFIFQQLSHQLPESARDVEAMVSGDQLLVRCSMNPSDLGDLAQLGPLSKSARRSRAGAVRRHARHREAGARGVSGADVPRSTTSRFRTR